MTRIITGPVIGFVDGTSARVLVEVDGKGPVTGEIRAVGVGKIVDRVTVNAEARMPVALQFGTLQPGVQYQVGFDVENGGERFGRFRTFDGTRGLKALVVSCSRMQAADLDPTAWRGVLAQVRSGEYDVLLHLGDQIYADELFESADHM